MSINLGDETITLTKTDRVCSIEIFLDDDDTVRLEFLREVLYKNAQGQIVHRKNTSTTRRVQADIATKQYTAGGVTRTGNQILMLVSRMSDDERQVDINNGIN